MGCQVSSVDDGGTTKEEGGAVSPCPGTPRQIVIPWIDHVEAKSASSLSTSALSLRKVDRSADEVLPAGTVFIVEDLDEPHAWATSAAVLTESALRDLQQSYLPIFAVANART